MYDEDDLLPISALQHLAFCERQWALIYLEGVWDENVLTVEGQLLHERSDSPDIEVRGGVRIARGLRLRSLRLGLTGRADVVEFQPLPESELHGTGTVPPGYAPLPGLPGLWRPFPVEYKHGRPKVGRCDEVQLCAQTLCLEEMLGVSIPAGAIFYGKPRRRYDVAFDEPLRKETESLAVRLHRLTEARETPLAKYEKKCRSCSIFSFCLPKATGVRRSSRTYLARMFEETKEEEM